jgi:hypothetical protein
MKWFRMYDDLLDNPKVQQLPLRLFKFYVNCLCLANRGEVRGDMGTVENIAFRMRLKPSDTEADLKELACRNLVECGQNFRFFPHDWHVRQAASDDGSLRKRRQRNNLRQNVTGHGTGQLRDSHGVEERREDNTPLTPQWGNGNGNGFNEQTFEQFYRAYPRHEAPKRAKAAWKRLNPDSALVERMLTWIKQAQLSEQWQDKTKIPHPATWLNGAYWEGDPPPPPKSNQPEITATKPAQIEWTYDERGNRIGGKKKA